MEHLPCEDRLRELELLSLEERRLKDNLSHVYGDVKGSVGGKEPGSAQ